MSLLFDGLLRPVLYATTKLERHYSYSAQERMWMIKLFIYQFLNKLTLLYSRTIFSLVSAETETSSFFDIFGFTTDWRNGRNSGGKDLISQALTVALGYNLMDLAEFALYWLLFNLLARTTHDKIQAYIGVQQRYSSKFTEILVVFAFSLCFSHV